jgi:spoIIIJ-associated protein
MEPRGSIFEGRTLDDAVRKGLEALGLSRAEVMITMVEEGSSGFLGLGARPYKVRVMPRPGGAPREPDYREGGSRSRREGREGRRGDGRRGREGREGRERRGRSGDAPPRGERNGGGERPGRREGAAVSAMDEDGEARRRRRGRRGGRGRRGERRSEVGPAEARPMTTEPEHAPQPTATAEARRDEPRESRREATSTTPLIGAAELTARASEATESLLKAMGFEAKVNARAEEDRVDVMVEVPSDDDLLTGRKGEVRQALQHLLTRMINRGEGSRYHLQLEINDFWQRREVEIQSVARELAEQAIQKNGEAISEYLNSQERRVLHVTLREDSRVKTYALGTGLIKRVAVAPADFPGGEGESH